MKIEEIEPLIIPFVKNSKKNIMLGLGSHGDFFLTADAAVRYNCDLFFWSNNQTITDNITPFANLYGLRHLIITPDTSMGYNAKMDSFFHHMCKTVFLGKTYITHNNMWFNFPIVDFTPNEKNQVYNQTTKLREKLPEKYFLFCPSGAFYDNNCKRMFYKEEFEKLILAARTSNHEPLLIGTDEQLNKYDNNKRFNRLQFDQLNEHKISPSDFLALVNDCEFVVSPDTSVKTLSCCMHKITFLLLSRKMNDEFFKVGEARWDYVFLNPEKWSYLIPCTFSELYYQTNKYSKVQGKHRIKFL